MDSTVIGDGRSRSSRASSLPLYIFIRYCETPWKKTKNLLENPGNLLEIYFSELLDTLRVSFTAVTL